MTSYPVDARRAEAEAMPIEDVALSLDILGSLKRAGHEYTGPCPQCGGDDRFSINIRKGVFQCRRCDGKGGGINLVMFVQGLTFPQALDWMCGPKREISESERRAREARDAANRKRKEREDAAFRERAIAQGRAIWRECVPAEGTAVVDYLSLRGLDRSRLPEIPRSIRFHPSLPYMLRDGTGYVELHRGPAMVAAIQGPDGIGTGIHRTWIDPSRPKGKAMILNPATGQPEKVKKSWGSKKGGAIRLSLRGAESPIMVMGEGIETTLTAMVADVWPGAVYWCGIDLGNMAGRRQIGQGLKHAGLPDLQDDEAFVPPPWVKRLIYVMDGDSDPKDTRAKLEAGLRRAMIMRPGLRGQIAAAPQGKDLNDVLMDVRAGDE